MNRRDLLKLSTIFALRPALAAGAATERGSGFRVGFAEADITPEISMEQPGGYGKSYHDKIHDPCKVRAVVLDDGRAPVALVGVDALLIPRNLVLAAREEIQKQCGIAPEAVMVGASHSHSSGPIGMIQPGDYDHASPLVQRLAYEHSTVDNPEYSRQVQKQIVAAVCEAHRGREALRCSVGVGHEEQVAFNRRFRMKNGLSWTHPGQGNPDIVEVAGPTDPEVSVIGAWDDAGRLRGCIVNFACHATTNPGGISANWIYYLEKTIRGAMGPDVNVVFLQGFCGDITQVDNLSPHKRLSGEDEAMLVGGRVGAEAVKVLHSTRPASGALLPLEARTTLLRMPRRAPDPGRVQRSLDIVKQDPERVGRTKWTFAKEIVLLDALLKKSPVAEVEVQAIQVGPAVFLATPGEMFVEFGLQMKKHSPFPFTVPVELANGVAGYVPTEEALSKTGGGYETRLTSYSNLEPAAGQQMVEAAVSLARRMKPGRPPEPPKAPAFGEGSEGIGPRPWSYGNVPAELR